MSCENGVLKLVWSVTFRALGFDCVELMRSNDRPAIKVNCCCNNLYVVFEDLFWTASDN
jgi:hypothetical protein